MLSLVPQFLAYRFLNGRWGPSSHVSGKLDWLSAHFLATLIDPAHGALLWTPIWLPALLGLALLWRRDRRLTLTLLAAFVAQSYLNGAFLTWHLSGAFGFRRLIEATPIFVLGLALLLDRLRLPRPLVVGLGVLLLAWNLGLIAQWSLPPRPIKQWARLGRYAPTTTRDTGRGAEQAAVAALRTLQTGRERKLLASVFTLQTTRGTRDSSAAITS